MALKDDHQTMPKNMCIEFISTEYLRCIWNSAKQQ